MNYPPELSPSSDSSLTSVSAITEMEPMRILQQQGATSDGASSDCSSSSECSSSSCPEELYNLTKLAEVSLAAANGTLFRPGIIQVRF